MTALAVPLEAARWTWAEGAAVPSGIVLDHGDHELLVPWAGGGDVFTLDSLLPLTVVEQVRCTMCEAEGRIERGAWLPSKDGAR